MTLNNNKLAFYVVQFWEMPYDGIDEYVCVPAEWIVVHRTRDGKAVVACPKDRDPSVTRDRVKRKERCIDE